MVPEVDDQAHFNDLPSRDTFRAAELAAEPRWYSPWAHLAGTTGVGVAAIAVSVPRIHDLTLAELLTVPAVFAVANVAEWHAHRNLLHRRWGPLAPLYDQHTARHHRIYRYGDLEIRSWSELRFVLIPPLGVLAIVVAAAPAAALAAWLLGANVGWLFLLTAALYVVGYELSHLSYHLPEHSLIGRLRLVRILREHHALHHDPRLMQRYNMNVTVPLADWVFKTNAPREVVADARARVALSGTSPPPTSPAASEGLRGA